MSRGDSYEVRVLSGGSIHLTFADLYPVATKYAGGTDRWVEIQPGYMGFHFASEDAYLKFREYVQAGYQVVLSAEIKKKTSKRFEESNIGAPPPPMPLVVGAKIARAFTDRHRKRSCIWRSRFRLALRRLPSTRARRCW